MKSLYKIHPSAEIALTTRDTGELLFDDIFQGRDCVYNNIPESDIFYLLDKSSYPTGDIYKFYSLSKGKVYYGRIANTLAFCDFFEEI